MDDLTLSADRIRADVKALRNRFGFVNIGQKCDLSGQPVLSGPFYIFPCTHVFLVDALVRHVRGPRPRPRSDEPTPRWHGRCGRAPLTPCPARADAT